jgi:cysteine desulfuration protein SufE
MTFQDIQDNFRLLDDWEDRYRYLIELGRTLPPMADHMKNDANKVRGCASQVWLATHIHMASDPRDVTLTFEGDSDSQIVRGLIAVLLAIYQGKSAREIHEFDTTEAFGEIGLTEHLTPQRSNGLASMVTRLRQDAAAVMSAGRVAAQDIGSRA